MSDTFRKAYRPLNADEADLVEAVKASAETLEAALDALPQPGEIGAPGRGRATSLARTKLEEAVMWAVKAITA